MRKIEKRIENGVEKIVIKEVVEQVVEELDVPTIQNKIKDYHNQQDEIKAHIETLEQDIENYRLDIQAIDEEVAVYQGYLDMSLQEEKEIVEVETEVKEVEAIEEAKPVEAPKPQPVPVQPQPAQPVSRFNGRFRR